VVGEAIHLFFFLLGWTFMKTITKVTALGVAALALVVGLNGCAEDNEKAAITDTATGKVTKGVNPVDGPRSSKDAYLQQMKNDPMKGNKGYRQAVQ